MRYEAGASDHRHLDMYANLSYRRFGMQSIWCKPIALGPRAPSLGGGR